MQIYCIIPDAYGGHGGISVFNKDLITAFARSADVANIYAVPRIILREVGNIPDKVHFRRSASRGKAAFALTILRDLPIIAKSDLLYCGHLNLAPLVKFLGRLCDIPVLGALYGIEAWTPSQRVLRRKAATSLEHYYAISNYTRDRFCEWSKLPKDRISLLPNAIHLADYGIAAPSSNIKESLGVEGRKVIMTFGRLVSRDRAKGFDEVLDVLPELVAEDPKITYIIAGEGPDSDRLKERVSSEGLKDHVIFTGFVDENEKADLYRIADLYVMPSRGEGFGFVFLEALACGVPVVASSVDGSRDAVRDGMLGRMVDPDNLDELKAAIRHGIKQPLGIHEGLKYFDYTNFQRRTSAILNQMVTK